jgi:hypothetical protein
MQVFVTKDHVKLQHLCVSLVEAISEEQGMCRPKMAKQPFDSYNRCTRYSCNVVYCMSLSQGYDARAGVPWPASG